MRKIKEILTEIKGTLVGFTLKVGILVIIGVLTTDIVTYFVTGKFDFAGVQVEAHGMIFDIIFFGLLIAYYDYRLEKKRNEERKEDLERKESEQKAEIKRREDEQEEIVIRGYIDQLESFREWHGEEAAFRVRYVVNVLEKRGIKELDLSYLHLGKLKLEKIIAEIKKETYGICLKGADLLNANLEKVKLTHVNLQEANLKGANLRNANLEIINLQDAKLEHTNLQGANLTGANLQGAWLWNADLQGADLEHAELQGAGLSYAKLQNSKLLSANFQGANLVDANLEGVDLWNTDLQRARLINANLQKANLGYVDLGGANLANAKLHGATAYETKREEFSKVMSEDQLNDITWIIDPHAPSLNE